VRAGSQGAARTAAHGERRSRRRFAARESLGGEAHRPGKTSYLVPALLCGARVLSLDRDAHAAGPSSSPRTCRSWPRRFGRPARVALLKVAPIYLCRYASARGPGGEQLTLEESGAGARATMNAMWRASARWGAHTQRG